MELPEAVHGLSAYGEDAKPLAGGQSLLPMMNFRLARPSVLVDLEHIPGLDSVVVSDGMLEIGAMARQADVARSAEVRRHLPLLSTALAHVGHHQTRTRGTIGGSLAHADPAAELPALALLCDAQMLAVGPSGTRALGAEHFFQAPFTTALAGDEVLASVHIPIGHIERWAFEEFSRRSGDFTIAGVVATQSHGSVRIVGFGLGWVPLRLHAAEAAIAADGLGDTGIGRAVAAARDEVEPIADVHASSDYRRDAVATLLERALRSMRT